jgi:hypothetical protein
MDEENKMFFEDLDPWVQDIIVDLFVSILEGKRKAQGLDIYQHSDHY